MRPPPIDTLPRPCRALATPGRRHRAVQRLRWIDLAVLVGTIGAGHVLFGAAVAADAMSIDARGLLAMSGVALWGLAGVLTYLVVASGRADIDWGFRSVSRDRRRASRVPQAAIERAALCLINEDRRFARSFADGVARLHEARGLYYEAAVWRRVEHWIGALLDPR